MNIDFRDWPIDTSKPGFYDDEEFLRREQQENSPDLLMAYAAFVNSRILTPEYVENTKRVVHAGARFIDAELKRDGRLGACVDASMVLCRFFEVEGVFCYIVKGALKVQFPRKTKSEAYYFWPMNRQGSAGHVWLAAPPFTVIDTTLAHQGWTGRTQGILTTPVVSTRNVRGNYNLNNLAEHDAQQEFRMQWGRKMTVADIRPGIEADIRQLGSRRLKHDDCTLTYVSCGASVPETGDMENWRNLSLNGKKPLELHAEFKCLLASC